MLTSPTTGLVTQDTTPDFSWNAVLYGDTYEIQIDNLASFAAPIEQTSVGLGQTYTATTLTDGRKYWRVRAINVDAENGAWSAARTITIDTTPPLAPAPYLPANLSTVRGTPLFYWLAVVSGKYYQFEYDENSDFSSPAYTSGSLLTTNHKPPVMPVGTFYWHVRVSDLTGNWSGWGASRTITIRPVIPVAPVLISPATSSVTLDTTPDFTWNAVPYGVTYEIQIDNLSSFAAPIEQTSAGLGLTYTATPLTEGLKYWRVRAINAEAENGAWSAVRALTIDTTPPLAPGLYLPANLATVHGTPLFYWYGVSTAKYYQFEYDDNSDFSSPVYTSVSLLTATHKPTTMLNGTYYWHVRASDLAGNWSPWSSSRQVTIIP